MHQFSIYLDNSNAYLSSYSAARRIENGLNKPTQPNKSSSQFQIKHPIEYVDSGLGESNNNQRPQSDLGYLGHKRQTSSVSLESPDFCEHYQCISSPNAPPSQTSSVLSESDDPWTRQSDARLSYRFEDHCRDVSYLIDSEILILFTN